MAEIDTTFVKGADKLKKRIASIRNAVDLPKTVAEVGALLERRTLTRFDNEVDPDSVRWAEWSEVTAIDRKRRGIEGTKLLKRSLTLRRSIKLIRGGSGTTFTNTGAEARIGIEDPKVAKYGKALNKGTKRIPARRFLGIGRLDIKAVDSLLRRKAAKFKDI